MPRCHSHSAGTPATICLQLRAVVRTANAFLCAPWWISCRKLLKPGGFRVDEQQSVTPLGARELASGFSHNLSYAAIILGSVAVLPLLPWMVYYQTYWAVLGASCHFRSLRYPAVWGGARAVSPCAQLVACIAYCYLSALTLFISE